MRKPLFILVLLGHVIIGLFYTAHKFYTRTRLVKNASSETKQLTESNVLRDGDIIFQTSVYRQSKAIQMATKSKYSHCGLIYKEDSTFYVLEAIQPVKRTPLQKWLTRGEEGHFIIKRLKRANWYLTPGTLKKMKAIGDQFTGKGYDHYYEWSDDKIYCSELVWKVYQRATGLEIGKVQKLKEFDLSSQLVKQRMSERFGTNIPTEETVISPAAIFNSELLTTVATN